MAHPDSHGGGTNPFLGPPKRDCLVEDTPNFGHTHISSHKTNLAETRAPSRKATNQRREPRVRDRKSEQLKWGRRRWRSLLYDVVVTQRWLAVGPRASPSGYPVPGRASSSDQHRCAPSFGPTAQPPHSGSSQSKRSHMTFLTQTANFHV